MSTIEVRYSDDGGNNWKDWRSLDAGETGDFLRPMVTRRLGLTRMATQDGTEFSTPLRLPISAVRGIAAGIAA